MNLVIETSDHSILERMLETKDFCVGYEIKIPGNATLIYDGRVSRKGIVAGLPEILEFTITFAAGTASSLVASWLYNKLKDRRVRIIEFNRKKVEVSKEGIEKTIEESLVSKEYKE